MDKEKKETKITQQGQGRVDRVATDVNKGDNLLGNRDISEIDRQEGDMEHGELGGNLNQEIKNNEK